MKLACKPPYDWGALVGFLGPRATPGVEWVRDGRYGRTIRAGGQPGTLEVWSAEDGTGVEAAIHLAGRREAGVGIEPEVEARAGVEAGVEVKIKVEVSSRARRLLDLDTDPAPVVAKLCEDPLLRAAVLARPGLRVPGAWDGFELAVRAILGQQVSVAAATTLAGRLVRAHGETLPVPTGRPTSGELRLFPQPEVLAAADLRELGLPRARAAAISSLAAAVAADATLMAPGQDVDAAARRLMDLPGIGPWTAQYIAMRWFRDADAFPASDLGLRRSLAAAAAAVGGGTGAMPTPVEVARRAEGWRPFRAYAAMHLWTALAASSARG